VSKLLNLPLGRNQTVIKPNISLIFGVGFIDTLKTKEEWILFKTC